MDENEAAEAARWFDAFCQALRENRREFTVEGVYGDIEIKNLRHSCTRSLNYFFPLMIDDERARRLVEALSGYNYPITFDLPMDRMDMNAAQILFPVLADRAMFCISEARLISRLEDQNEDTMASLGDRINSFLTAAALHGKLQSLDVELHFNSSATALAICLHNNNDTIQKLGFVLRNFRLDNQPFPRQLNATLLANTISTMSSLNELEIDCHHDNFNWFIIAVLEGIKDHPGLNKLAINTNWGCNPKQLALALQNVLRSSTPLKYLYLQACGREPGILPINDIKSIVESIYDHPTLDLFLDNSMLRFQSSPELYTYAESQQVVQLYVQLINTNRTINDLSVCCQYKTQVADIFEAISKTNTSLNRLTIYFTHEGVFIDEEECQKLNVYLPKMKHLEILAVLDVDFHTKLLAGFEGNFSLKSTDVSFGNRADASPLGFYMMRNNHLADLANLRSKKEFLCAIQRILDGENRFSLSVVFEVLRHCDGWFATADREIRAQ